MQDAETVVTEAYGMFVHTDDDSHGDEEVANDLEGKGRAATGGAENGGSAGGSRTVAV